MRRILTGCLLFVFVCSLGLFAQERTGNVAGVVTDGSGAVLPDVTVVVKNKVTERALTLKTRSDGSYSALEIEPGRYSVVFEKQGFGKYEVPDVIVLLGKTANVSASMKVGSVAEKIEVTGAAPLIDTMSTTVAANVTAEELDRLPKGRTFQAVAQFSPSVNTGTIEGGLQVNGASAAENAYYIDGVSTNSVVDGSARQSATFDYIQEVQVKTTGVDAEYGGALGGVVSAVTKSGGNAFHGDIHYYYYGNKLNAGPARRMVMDPNSKNGWADPETQKVRTYAVYNYFQDTKDQRDTHEFGGSLGGPILKDKIFFYQSFVPTWQRRSAGYEFTEVANPLVVAPGTMNRTYNQIQSFSKLSIEPTSRLRSNFTFLYTPVSQQGSLYAYNAFAANRSTQNTESALLNKNRGYHQSENSVTGQVDYTFTNTSLISVKGGRYFLNYKDNGVPTNGSYFWPISSSTYAGLDPYFQRGTGASTPSGAKTAHDITTRTYVQADFTQMFNFVGRHNLKAGYGTQKNVNNVDQLDFGTDGRVDWYFGQSCGFVGCVIKTGTYGYYAIQEGGTQGSAGATINSFYFQDAWQPISRLTINAGVRFEKETIPSFAPEVQKYAMQFGYADKIGPRLGASYDLFGNGKVKISGGWGRYYDWTKYDVARGTFGADVWHTYYYTIDTLDTATLKSANLNHKIGQNMLAGAFRNRRVPGFDLLDPNVKPMSSDSMNAGVEWEVAKNMVFSGRYVRSKLNRTIEDMGVLDANGDEIYRYGNPGEGANKVLPASGDTCVVKVGTDQKCAVPMPKATRVYDAMELSLSKRFGAGWLANVSYVFSRLYGNYSGLQSTDEIRPTTGGGGFAGAQQFAGQIYRPGGNANRYFDLDEALYDGNGKWGLEGRLPTDRPHVIKFYGSKTFKFGTDVGTYFRVMSGTPVTTQVFTTNGIPFYVNGRGDMGRTPVFTQTDVVVGHTFKVAEGKSLRFEMNMLNLFNSKTETYRYDRYTVEANETSTGLDLSGTNLAAGFNYKSLLAAQAAAINPDTGLPRGYVDLDPRYGQPAEFNAGFQGRLLIKYTF